MGGLLSVYGNIFIFFAAGFLLVFVNMLIVRIVAPHRPSPEKNATYECGEEPVGSGWINFNARFYLIAILFIIFDVEIVLVFPVIVNYRDFLLSGRGLVAFADIFIFAAILFLGLVYAWRNGYLEWPRGVRRQLRVEGPVIMLKDRIAEQASEHDRGGDDRAA